MDIFMAVPAKKIKTDNPYNDLERMGDLSQWNLKCLINRGRFGTICLYGHRIQINYQIAVQEIKFNINQSLNDIQKFVNDINCKYRRSTLKFSRLLELYYCKLDAESFIVYIYWEYLPCGSLLTLLSNGGLDLFSTVKYTQQVLEGVAYLHKNSIVHQDIRGKNILRDYMDNVKLADYGLLVHLQNFTTSHPNIEIVNWTAPEVLMGIGYDYKSDIWSIGCTVVEMLTAHPPWHNVNKTEIMTHMQQREYPTYDLSTLNCGEVEIFLKLCFQADPLERPSATDLMSSNFCKLRGVDEAIDLNHLHDTDHWTQIKPLLGRGSYGDVYKYIHKKTGFNIVVKSCEFDPATNEIDDKMKQLINESKRLERLPAHPRIVKYLGCDENREKCTLYIALELVSGGSLYSFLQKHNSQNMMTTIKFTRQILEGVAYLHANGITHRDIKSKNILLDASQNIKLADFGLSKEIKPAPSAQHTVGVGSNRYKAPEIFTKKYDCKVDIWSVGCTVVEILTKHPPWHELDEIKLTREIDNPNSYPSYNLPEDCHEADEILQLCFKRDPKERPSANELLELKLLNKKEDIIIRSTFQEESLYLNDGAPSQQQLSQYQIMTDDSITRNRRFHDDIQHLHDSNYWRRKNLLGRGSTADVWLYTSVKSQQAIAVKQAKFYPSDLKNNYDIKALMNEINLLKSLSHDRIVKYVGCCFKNEDYIFSVCMEYMSGDSLSKLISQRGPLDYDRVRKYTRQILEGVDYLHRQRIIHRDIKGTNILLDQHNNIKLADFAISKQLESFFSTHGTYTVGFWAIKWMAPEIISGKEYGYNVDIWSIGCTVVEMLTCNPPWHELSHTLAFMRLSKGVFPTYELLENHDDINSFLECCFRIEPANRPSARELLLKSDFCKSRFSSCELIRNFQVSQLGEKDVSILSVFNTELQIGTRTKSQLFVYRREGKGRNSPIEICYDDDELRDAIKVPQGNVLYTTTDNKLVIKLNTKKVIYPQIEFPSTFSVSEEKIYLAANDGVYLSTDSGETWNRIVDIAEGWNCKHAIEVDDNIWTLEHKGNVYQICVHSMERTADSLPSRMTSKTTIKVETTSKEQIKLSNHSRLAYDGHASVFLNNFENSTVHVFSVNGQYCKKVISAENIPGFEGPLRMKIDYKNQLLYVSQTKGKVGVFQLKYD